VLEAHRSAKGALIDEVNRKTGMGMDREALTIGFARRMTACNRAALILSDLEMLRKINRKHLMKK
jgi:glycogen phosphorylase